MPFPTTQEWIDRAAAALAVRLPIELETRLLRDNGGELAFEDDDWILHPVQDTSDRQRAGRTAAHLVAENIEAREWPDFPSDAVAIATNGLGDRLILRKEVNGALGSTLYFWDHETGETTPHGELRDLL